MSPRWIDRLLARVRGRGRHVRVYLGTGRVSADLLDRRGALLHAVTRAVDAGQAGRPQAGAALDTLADALQSLQAEAGALHGLACEVLLADSWVVYDVIALDLARVAQPAAQHAIGAALADVAGVAAADLEVRWQAQQAGTSVFAMAVPRALLDQARALLGAFGLHVRSVTGEFVAVFNAQRHALTGTRAVLAVGRESGAQLAVLVDRAIAATRFELGRNEGNALAQAAAGVLRARGEDTTAPVAYLLDADVDAPDAAGHWTRVAPPAWADTVRQRPAHAAAEA